MFSRLLLKDFKNFRKEELILGPLTILVGANASGKSNVREALRFLHGVSRDYSLAEIFGEKWGDQGVLEWRGIRGGIREAAYRQSSSFSIAVELTGKPISDPWVDADFTSRFSIEIGIDRNLINPMLLSESLMHHIGTEDAERNAPEALVYRTSPGLPVGGRGAGEQPKPAELPIQFATSGDYDVSQSSEPGLPLFAHSIIRRERPGLHQLYSSADKRLGFIADPLSDLIHRLGGMRFLDLSPDEMRRASPIGQSVLTDRGENLSSVLHGICASEASKAALIRWLRLLTPMDVTDLLFPMDPAGRVLLSIVEQDGTSVSAYSASDGTLRFLGILAAVLSPRPPRLLFLEELENGLHPSRLRLLLDLLRERTRTGEIQVVATTHSPALLALLDGQTLAHTSLFFRREGEQEAHIQPLLGLPDAARILKEHDRARLLASGWFENIVEFAAAPSEPLNAVGSPS